MGAKNEPKTPGSGRKKGSRNKDTQYVHELAQKLGVDPIEVLLLFAKGDAKTLGYQGFVDSDGDIQKQVPMDLRIQAARAVAKYMYPELKQVEVKADDGSIFRPAVIVLPSNGREVNGDSAEPDQTAAGSANAVPDDNG